MKATGKKARRRRADAAFADLFSGGLLIALGLALILKADHNLETNRKELA